jgi:hypothetical protein
VYLGLSSTFEKLRNNPYYSVRFANENMWDSSLGLNKIGVIDLKTGGNHNLEHELIQIIAH